MDEDSSRMYMDCPQTTTVSPLKWHIIWDATTEGVSYLFTSWYFLFMYCRGKEKLSLWETSLKKNLTVPQNGNDSCEQFSCV